MSVLSNISKTMRYMKRNGARDAFSAAMERLERNARTHYSYVAPDDGELAKQRKETSGPEGWPSITIVMPTYNTDEHFFREALSSVLKQSYPHWKLVIADASDSDTVRRWADKCASEPRIRYVELDSNRGISGNTNAGIDAALDDTSHRPCDYIAFMDHDDVLTPDALYHMAAAIRGGNPMLLYSDEDKMSEDSKRVISYFDPHRKYDFNYDLLMTNNYICHLMVVRSDMLKSIRVRSAYDGAQDYDLVLQLVISLIKDYGLQTYELCEYIVHVPRILYHWRCHRDSTAANTSSKEYAYEAGLRAVTNMVNELYGREKYDDNGYPRVSHSKHRGFYEVDWGISGLGEGTSVADLADTKALVDRGVVLREFFNVRQDVGAVIGRVLDNRGRMSECIADKAGNWLYAGTPKNYSGELNRFDCNQDVFVADIHHVIVRPELEGLLKSGGVTSDTNAASGDGVAAADPAGGDGSMAVSESGDESVAASRAFADELRRLGYLILYIPKLY